MRGSDFNNYVPWGFVLVMVVIALACVAIGYVLGTVLV